jgi:hypothetical protein
MTMPCELEYWTADEVAECLTNGGDLYTKLYEFKNNATNPTPVWSQYPEDRLSLENDDKAVHWWHLLTEQEQQSIIKELNDAYDRNLRDV